MQWAKNDDGGGIASGIGTEQYTSYLPLDQASSSTWSEWASPINGGSDPEAVRIYFNATTFTLNPTINPTINPTTNPTLNPTKNPSKTSIAPTMQPTKSPTQTFQLLANIIFDEITNETFGGSVLYEIGWKKVSFCWEGNTDTNASLHYLSFNGEVVADYYYMALLAPYAISIKFVPDNINDPAFDEYAVYAQVCKNPIIALNALQELSFEINPETLQFVNYSNIVFVENNW